MTAIEEAKDLKKLTLEELLDSLITHEQTLLQDKEEGATKKNERKDFSLKSALKNLEVSDDDDLDVSLLTNKFKRCLKSKEGLREW